MFPVAFAAVAVAASGGAATVACSAAALLLLRELVVEWRNAVASWYGAKRKDPDKRISPTLLSSSSPPFSSIKLYSSSIPFSFSCLHPFSGGALLIYEEKIQLDKWVCLKTEPIS
jgi:hypothetical protein